MALSGLEPRSLHRNPQQILFLGILRKDVLDHGPWSCASRSQVLDEVKDHVYLYPVILVTSNVYSIRLDFLHSLSRSGISILKVSGK